MRLLFRLAPLVVFTTLCLTSYSQLVRDLHRLYSPTSYFQGKADTSTFIPHSLRASGPQYSVEVGSSFSNFAGGFSSSYFSPTISFMASEKLQIVAGGKFSHNTFSQAMLIGGNIPENSMNNGLGNPAEAFAFGRYEINNKFSVYGLTSFGKNQLYFSPFSTGIGTANYQHLSFGMDYRISDRTSIGASFGVSNGPAWGISPISNHRNPFGSYFP